MHEASHLFATVRPFVRMGDGAVIELEDGSGQVRVAHRDENAARRRRSRRLGGASVFGLLHRCLLRLMPPRRTGGDY